VKNPTVLPLLIALFITVHFTGIRREAPNDADAAEVMRQVVAAYHSLTTYGDKGTSIIHLASVDYRVEFETLFRRPGKLRFAWTVEYSETPGHKHSSLIWSDGTTAWASYSFRGNKLEPKKNLDLAVAGAIGASWGTANTIPRLLTDEISTVRLDELNRLRMIDNETVDGIECLVLVGYFASGEECKVWVGRGDYLIRRIEERSETTKREEVRTNIAINQELADSRFTERGY
jgi:outer membrane lipoprotein-sorting protein